MGAGGALSPSCGGQPSRALRVGWPRQSPAEPAGHDVDAASEPGSEAPLEDGMSEAPEPDFEAMLRSGGKGRGGRGRGRGRKASQGGGKGRETGELSASQAAAVEKLKQELGAKKQEFSDDVTRQHLIMRQKHIFFHYVLPTLRFLDHYSIAIYYHCHCLRCLTMDHDPWQCNIY